MSVFRPARQYLQASLGSAVLAALAAWCGVEWPWAYFPAALFAVACGALYYLGSRPSIRVSESDLRIGKESVLWEQIRSVETTGWTSPLILHLTLDDDRRIRLVYPGDSDGVARFARQFRRRARSALAAGGSTAAALAAPPVRLLSVEDEAEVERLFQQLRSAGRMDVAGGDD